MTAPGEHSIRPLIMGAGGLVGRELTDFMEARYPHTSSATRVEMDLTDRWRMEAELERLAPSVVINSAAWSGVDACERDPEQAFSINAHGPAHLAQICRNVGIKLVHISTDYVFDGTKGEDYDEADPTNPVNVYGQSKLAGENAVLETLADAIVLRVSFVFGPGRQTYIDKLAEQALTSDEPVPVIEGWLSKPTYTAQICQTIDELIRADETGIWHVANGPSGHRAGFARAVFELLGADPARIVGIDPSELTLDAKRPDATPLSTNRLEARFGSPLRTWTDWAKEYFTLNPPRFEKS